LISWVERECRAMRERGELALDLPPNFFPYILPEDSDWHPRYAITNGPGEYHNGGVWPFICGFYVAALVAAGKQRLAEKNLEAFTRLVRPPPCTSTPPSPSSKNAPPSSTKSAPRLHPTEATGPELVACKPSHCARPLASLFVLLTCRLDNPQPSY
jgi:hypothetical protein